MNSFISAFILISFALFFAIVLRIIIDRIITYYKRKNNNPVPMTMSVSEALAIERDKKLDRLLPTKKHTIFSILKKVGQILLIPITLYKYF